MKETSMQAPQQAASYITFKLGDELFAIDVVQVREVIDLSPIARVPTAPHYLRGVVNVRGKAIPVVDLRRKFGLPDVAPTVNTRILVLEIYWDEERCVVGGLADSVHDVIELAPHEIEPTPKLAARWRNQIIRGLARRDSDFVMVLEVNRVFELDELTVLAQPAAAASLAEAM
jgi:purine-binding chemotaxis protein CheW